MVASADVGLYGPASVTWRVHADPLLGVAVLRALLLQALHPTAAAASVEHPLAGGDLWGRLARVLDYLGVTTFGSTPEAMVAGARERGVNLINGLGSAAAARVLLWQHCCLVDSLLQVVLRGGLQLTDSEQDRYLTEQVRAATLLGLEPGDVPADRASLARRVAGSRPELRLTWPARQAAIESMALDGEPQRPPVVAQLDGHRRARSAVGSRTGSPSSGAGIAARSGAGSAPLPMVGAARAEALAFDRPDSFDGADSFDRPDAFDGPDSFDGADSFDRAELNAGPAARPPWTPVAGLAFAALPQWARQLYGLSDLPPAAGLSPAATTVGLRSLRSALGGAWY